MRQHWGVNFVHLRRFAFLISFLLTLSALTAQATGTWAPRDSIRRALQTRPGFRVGLDGKNSFLNGNAVRVAGARYGLDYGKIGLYTGLYSTQIARFGAKDTAVAGFSYMSSTLEYYLYQSWRFEVVSSYQIGIGNGFDFYKSGTEIKRNFKGVIVPVEAGIGGTVRFLRYLGFCAGVGVRMSLSNGNGFSGSYYYYGLTFFTGTMYRDFKKLIKKD
jgi:hypothetical protein